MPMDSSPDPTTPGSQSEAEERYQWIIRSAAIISMLLAMTVLNETNVMVPKQVRMAVPFNVNLPRVAPGMGSTTTIILEPVPAPRVDASQPRVMTSPIYQHAARPAPTAVPSAPDSPPADSNLMLQMPGPSLQPDAQVALASPTQALPIHASVAASSGPNANSTAFKGLRSPKVSSRKVIKPANIGGGLKTGAPAGTDRKVVPASIPGQVGSMKTGNYGKVAPVAIPSTAGTGAKESNGKVGNVRIPGVTTYTVAPKLPVAPATGKVGLLSKAPIQLGADDGN
jgi:hypothetical protein